jgi:hypothetical protein
VLEDGLNILDAFDSDLFAVAMKARDQRIHQEDISVTQSVPAVAVIRPAVAAWIADTF